jgi:hypothetical protein
MNFKEVREIIQAAAETLGMDYYFGKEGDAFLDRLVSGELSDTGHCLQHDTSEGVKVTGGWTLLPIRLSLLKQTNRNTGLTDEQELNGGEPREDTRLLMYNLWVDMIDEIDSNFNLQVQDEWTYSFLSYGDNVTEGIIVNCNIMIYDC